MCVFAAHMHFKRYAYVSLNKSKWTLLCLRYGPSLVVPLQWHKGTVIQPYAKKLAYFISNFNCKFICKYSNER